MTDDELIQKAALYLKKRLIELKKELADYAKRGITGDVCPTLYIPPPQAKVAPLTPMSKAAFKLNLLKEGTVERPRRSARNRRLVHNYY